jgi:cytochrome c
MTSGRALTACLIATLAGAPAACATHRESTATQMVAGGDPSQGPAVMRALGCHGCHVIPGVRAATGRVGPPLDAMSERRYIAGAVDNTPENLVRWLRNPPGIVPATAMPDVGATESEARHMAAYLLTLK